MLDLALSGLDDRTIDLAGAHGDAGEADFVQAADGVDIATVLATDEDFELRIDGASVSDESADHLLDCRVDGDERMTLEEFLWLVNYEVCVTNRGKLRRRNPHKYCILYKVETQRTHPP